MPDQHNPGDGYPLGMGPQLGAGQFGQAQSDPANPQWPPPDGPQAAPAGGYPADVPAPPGFGSQDGPEVVAHRGLPSADEQPRKKKKIDLKERLSSVRAAGTMAGAPTPAAEAAFPPAPARGSVPPPRVLSSDGIAPPPAIAALVGLGPKEDDAPRPTAAQQTIKVEMGEEVLAERRKARKQTLLYVAIVAVAALAAGFGLGGVKAKGDAGRLAVAGASELAKQVEESNKVLADLSDTLRVGSEQLAAEKFPTELAEKLKSINVPFSANGLQGKLISGLPGSTLQGLLRLSLGVEDLNKTKDKLRNLLGVAQKPVEEYVAEKKEPMVRFSVVFANGKFGTIAEFAPIKEPFKLSEKWPDSLKVTRLVNDAAKELEATRWSKGDLTGGDKPPAILVDPKTVAGFTQKQVVFQLKGAIEDTRSLVEGKQSQIPSEQTDGLLKEGDRLVQELKKVARAGS
jgi:hypothetical protein